MKRVLVKAEKKLRSKKGETLTETLGSLLIIVPGMVMLAGALVSASQINDEVRTSASLKPPVYSAGQTIATDNKSVSYGGKTVNFRFVWSKDSTDSYYSYFR